MGEYEQAFDEATIADILNRHSNLNFVQRVMSPDKFPVINNPDGSVSTHKMAWGSYGNQHVVFPTIVYDEKTGTLKDLGKEAFDYAIKNKQYIPFNNPKEAESFSINYKKGSRLIPK